MPPVAVHFRGAIVHSAAVGGPAQVQLEVGEGLAVRLVKFESVNCEKVAIVKMTAYSEGKET